MMVEFVTKYWLLILCVALVIVAARRYFRLAEARRYGRQLEKMDAPDRLSQTLTKAPPRRPNPIDPDVLHDLRKCLASQEATVLASLSINDDPPARVLQALRVFSGKLIEKIPRSMVVGRREQVEVRLGENLTPNMMMGLIGAGAVTVHDLPVVETMAVDLYAPNSSFEIEACSDREQLIKTESLATTALSPFSQPFGRWLWNVTPLKTGSQLLALRISARVLDSNGYPTPHTLVPDRTLNISVRVNRLAIARKVFYWLGITVPTALLLMVAGAAMQEEGWPIVKRWFAWLVSQV